MVNFRWEGTPSSPISLDSDFRVAFQWPLNHYCNMALPAWPLWSIATSLICAPNASMFNPSLQQSMKPKAAAHRERPAKLLAPKDSSLKSSICIWERRLWPPKTEVVRISLEEPPAKLRMEQWVTPRGKKTKESTTAWSLTRLESFWTVEIFFTADITI